MNIREPMTYNEHGVVFLYRSLTLASSIPRKQRIYGCAPVNTGRKYQSTRLLRLASHRYRIP